MSQRELVSAYLEGQLSRRTLIRRLVAGGVSASAAVSYAQLLSPQRAQAARTAGLVADEHYPLVEMAITTPTLDDVRQSQKLRVELVALEEVKTLRLRVLVKSGRGLFVIGKQEFADPLTDGRGGTRVLKVPVTTDRLAGRGEAIFFVYGDGEDADQFPVLAVAKRALS